MVADTKAGSATIINPATVKMAENLESSGVAAKFPGVGDAIIEVEL